MSGNGSGPRDNWPGSAGLAGELRRSRETRVGRLRRIQRHVRAGLEQGTTLDQLRELWMPISPWPFIDRRSSAAQRWRAANVSGAPGMGTGGTAA